MKERFQELMQRTEAFLRDFEWNWTRAVLFSLAFVAYLLLFAVIVPSFWMYFAEQKLGWAGPTDLEAFLQAPFSEEGLLMVRDAVAMGLTVGPIVTAMVVASIFQNRRRRLRGTSADRPTGGYR